MLPLRIERISHAVHLLLLHRCRAHSLLLPVVHLMHVVRVHAHWRWRLLLIITLHGPELLPILLRLPRYKLTRLPLCLLVELLLRALSTRKLMLLLSVLMMIVRHKLALLLIVVLIRRVPLARLAAVLCRSSIIVGSEWASGCGHAEGRRVGVHRLRCVVLIHAWVNRRYKLLGRHERFYFRHIFE